MFCNALNTGNFFNFCLNFAGPLCTMSPFAVAGNNRMADKELDAAKRMSAAASEWIDQYRKFLAAVGKGSFGEAHKSSVDKLKPLEAAMEQAARAWTEEQGRMAAHAGAEAREVAGARWRWRRAPVVRQLSR